MSILRWVRLSRGDEKMTSGAMAPEQRCLAVDYVPIAVLEAAEALLNAWCELITNS
jgi:hypothetical protein